ncbi:MAG: hypothetical protein AABM30_04895 [Actinomycetota bacterium]
MPEDAPKYDYRVTVESRPGTSRTFNFQSSAKIEVGQVLDLGGRRCAVSNVSPDPRITRGKPQIVFVQCFEVDDEP